MTEQIKIDFEKTIKTSTFSESDTELKKSFLNATSSLLVILSGFDSLEEVLPVLVVMQDAKLITIEHQQRTYNIFLEDFNRGVIL